ncbi:MAG: YwiC-like family protein [Chloroflexota bacterium]
MKAQARSDLPARLFQRQIAIPIEHGSWVFLLSPLLIGLAAAGQFSSATGWLALAVVAGFFFRQPLTIAVKVLSKRRPEREWLPALFWMGVYAVGALVGVAGIVQAGQAFILVLGIPALPVLVWHLWLVSRREERRKPLVEIAGSGVLALSAPAAYWAGTNALNATGWLLWLLLWLQAAGSILYTYLRLEQRVWKEVPDVRARWKAGILPLMVTSLSLLAATTLAVQGWLPGLLPLAYLIQLAETMWGILRPALGVKPVAIGVRQLIVSVVFTLAFAALWLAG